MLNEFSRTERLLGSEAMSLLKKARVAIFGIGGVGGYVAEALARSGIFNLDLIDNDTVSLTNINRQIIALHSTIGRPKVEVMKERILDINPQVQVETFQCFYLPQTRELFDFSKYDYIVDAVDTVTAKIQLIIEAKAAGKPIICSMGAGNKLDPTAFEITDISKTSVCPLARVMRQECKKRGISDVKVLYSKENSLSTEKVFNPEKSDEIQNSTSNQNLEVKGNGLAPGSCAFVPSVAGLIIAAEVIKDLTNR
ncbi:MAG: tRNA threonylcarbamoyladenosine dehydratase [Treponema sp.]|nr:tRNA threonylcarbamoyladenosine dehydratase [Treponema sp.]